MPTVEIYSKTYVNEEGRLRTYWDCKLKILGSSTNIHLSGYYDSRYRTEERCDYIEILAKYRTDEGIVDDRIFRSLDMVSVLRSVLADMGLNPDCVTCKLMEEKIEVKTEQIED